MVKNCPNCGKPLKDGYDFCGKCGFKIPEIAEKTVEGKEEIKETQEDLEEDFGKSDDDLEQPSVEDMEEIKNKPKGKYLPLIIIIVIVISLIALAIFLSQDSNDGILSNNSGGTVNNIKPNAYCSATPTSGAIPLTVSFTGSGSDSDGYISSYNWDFKDGSKSSSQNPSHTFTTSGTYYVTFTVTDNDGGKDTDSVTITVLSDSDGDGISDSDDIYDYGNGAIKVTIDEYHCDKDWDELYDWSQLDTYFKIEVYSYESQGGPSTYHGQWTSTGFTDDTDLYNPYYIIVDVGDDVQKIYVYIEAWDDDFFVDPDDPIDLSGDTASTYGIGEYFYPLSYSSKSYSDDGRLDLADEFDGWIEYTIEVVKY